MNAAAPAAHLISPRPQTPFLWLCVSISEAIGETPGSDLVTSLTASRGWDLECDDGKWTSCVTGEDERAELDHSKCPQPETG